MADFTIPDKMDHHLFLGKANSAANLATLQRLGITRVLMVGSNLEAHFPDNLAYKHVVMEDSWLQDIRQHFAECFEFIDAEPRANVLVHCQAGVSRSATIVLAYMMRTYHLSYDHAFHICKKRRHAIGPNANFVEQLRQFEACCVVTTLPLLIPGNSPQNNIKP
jgi:protein-tyrosine phosphatase